MTKNSERFLCLDDVMNKTGLGRSTIYNKMKIRSSQSMTETTTEAFLYCFDCGIKAKAFAEVKEIEIAEYKPLVLTGGTINKIRRTSS